MKCVGSHLDPGLKLLIVVVFCYHWTLSISCAAAFTFQLKASFLHHSCQKDKVFYWANVCVLTSFINVTKPALTHACRRPQGHKYMFLKEDGKGLDSRLWRVNALTATQGYTHRMESIHKIHHYLNKVIPKITFELSHRNLQYLITPAQLLGLGFHM